MKVLMFRLLYLMMLPQAFACAEMAKFTITLDQGMFFALPEYWTFSSTHIWDKHGKKFPTFNTFIQKEYGIYLGYAPTTSDNLFANLRYAHTKESLNSNRMGFEDPEFTWKHLCGEWPREALFFQLTGILPAGKQWIPVRYGRAGGEFDLIYQGCAHILQHESWLGLLIGYRTYMEEPSDQIRNALEIGCQLTTNLEIRLNSFLTYGLFNGRKGTHPNTELLNYNYRVWKVGGEVIYNLTNLFAIDFGFYQHVWGKNVGTGGGIYGALRMVF